MRENIAMNNQADANSVISGEAEAMNSLWNYLMDMGRLVNVWIKWWTKTKNCYCTYILKSKSINT